MYQFLLVTPIFHVSCRTLGLAFVKSTKESYRIGEHFNSTLAFRKIHRRIRSTRMESLEIRTEEHLSTPNTKFDKVKLPSRHRPLFVRHYRAKKLPNTAVKDVFNYCTQMQKNWRATITFISSLILHWLIKLLLNVTFRMKLKIESENH